MLPVSQRALIKEWWQLESQANFVYTVAMATSGKIVYIHIDRVNRLHLKYVH